MAPMDDVVDNAFRQVMMKVGRPDAFFTEFTNIDGLVHGGNGIPLRKLEYTDDQHPIVAQLWGTDTKNMEKSAKIAAKMGFDGIDINMGCPVREVIKKGAGSGLIGNYELAEQLIKSAKNGAGKIPVSIKTRLGRNTNIADEWIPFLLKQNIAALTIHARTAKQMSKVPADWDEIGKIVEIKNSISPQTIIVGNGDVENYKTIADMNKRYGVDGVMVGRGVFKNPWVFVKNTSDQKHSKNDYLEIFNYHLDLYDKLYKGTKHYAALKKFFKMYIKDFRGANTLRMKLMETNSSDEAREIIKTTY